MRTDLTAAFQTEMAKQGRQPVQLGIFHFSFAGDVFVSDRNMGPADGLADTYQGLVENFGALSEVLGDSLETPTAANRQLTITLFNSGSLPFSNYFLKEDPENVTVDIYQWFLGLDESDKALIDSFVVQDPIRFNERSRLIELDLVSISLRYEGYVGQPLTFDAFANAKTEDIGKPIDLVLGNAGQVPSLCARTAPVATQNGSILRDTMTIATNENLDDLNFTATGIIQIDEEKIRYSSRTAYAFNVVQRGYLSEAAEHLDRDKITQHVDDFTYIIGQGPVAAISQVKVGGFDAPAGIYSVHPDQDPARIIFTEKPYSYQFAKGSTFLEMQFDASNSDNTARYPHRAYDPASDATAAEIDEDHRLLSLKQATVMASRGEIVKAYLAVEHWESKPFANDYAEVSLSGIGVLGRLSQPNNDDTLEIDAEVDIDHGHGHSISGEHTHYFHDPGYVVDDESHTHASTLTSPPDTKHPKLGDDLEINLDLNQSFRVYYSGMPDQIEGGTLTFHAYVSQCVLYCDGKLVSSDGYSKSYSISAKNHEYVTVFYCNRGDFSGSSIQCRITNIRASVYESSAIAYENIDINLNMAYSGTNVDASDKDPSDVEDLATDNVAVQLNTAETATRSHVNLFDITNQVNFDWTWFNNREVRVEYKGSHDNAKIYILHCFFDVEYRKRERVFSDDITADVQGLIDDGAGTITGTGSALITRPDHVYKYLLTDKSGYAPSMIDSTSFANAGTRFAALGYTIDGVLNGAATVKETLKKMAWQTRSRYFYNAGQIKLSVLEKLEDWPDGPELTTANLQLRSMGAERQPVNEIVNHIDLFYQRDWTADDNSAAGYSASTTGRHTVSINQHGSRKRPDDFLFDLVRTSGMASNLVDFYIDRLAVPSTYYRFNAYLELFDFERNDIFKLTNEAFHKLRKTKMMVAAITRVFGSGKNRTINHLQILAEVLRYFLHEETIEDAVLALDALAISLAMEADFDESQAVLDFFSAGIGIAATDAATVSDAFASETYFAPQIDETITPAETLTHDMGLALEDQCNILEDVDGYRHYGFGGGMYSATGFGGYVIWRNRAPDEVQAAIHLYIDLVPGAFDETATIADVLALSSGFGTPLGSGFGLVPFGS
jgi:hypothetical protein